MKLYRALSLSTLLLLASAHAAAFIVPAPPAGDNKAFVVMDYHSGRVLAESNSHLKLEPASLTKMMTSYIVERSLSSNRLKESDPVRVSEYAWCRGTSAESCMYLPLNSEAPVIDMLRGVIIQSGNDASKALAEHIGGSEPAFAEIMNAEAKRLGMKDSHFMNATGLPDPDHLTSAHDMAVLARAIIHDNPTYYPIYAEKEFTWNGIKQGNRNALLYTDPTVDGLKTGHTDNAGFCLVASSKRGDMRLITVVMGTKSMNARADQTRALLNWGYSSFETIKPLTAGRVLGTSRVWYGSENSVKVGLARDLLITLPRGSRERLKTTTQLSDDLEAPFAKGKKVGQIVMSVDGKTVATQDVVALEAVEEANFIARFWDHLKRFFSNLF